MDGIDGFRVRNFCPEMVSFFNSFVEMEIRVSLRRGQTVSPPRLAAQRTFVCKGLQRLQPLVTITLRLHQCWSVFWGRRGRDIVEASLLGERERDKRVWTGLRKGSIQVQSSWVFALCCSVHDVLNPSSQHQSLELQDGKGGKWSNRVYIYLGREQRGPRPLPLRIGASVWTRRDQRQAQTGRLASTPRNPPSSPQQPHARRPWGLQQRSSHLLPKCDQNLPSQQQLQLQLQRQRTHIHTFAVAFFASSWLPAGLLFWGTSSDEPMGPSLLSASV